MEIKNLPKDFQIIAGMWCSGKTGIEIATALGITRNAVLGKIYRMRRNGHILPWKQCAPPVRVAKPIKEKNNQSDNLVVLKKRSLIDKKARLYIKPEPDLKIKGKRNVTFLNLKLSSCRYIIGEPNGAKTIYCGATKQRGSFCMEHAKLCYVPSKYGAASDKPFAAQSAFAR